MPAVLVIAELDSEYVRVPVSGKEQGSSADPTADAVEFALMDIDVDPGSSDWIVAEWETDTSTNPNRYFARILSSDLTHTTTGILYDLWLRFTDNPEVVVRKVGSVRFT